MTLDKSLFSAKCLAKSSRFSSFKKATSSAGLVGAAQLCPVCPVPAQDSPVPVSQPCSCRVHLSSCPHDGTASFWLSPRLTQTRASGLLTSMTQLPELMIQRLLAPVLMLLMLTVHSIPSRPFSSPSRHHLCSPQRRSVFKTNGDHPAELFTWTHPGSAHFPTGMLFREMVGLKMMYKMMGLKVVSKYGNADL